MVATRSFKLYRDYWECGILYNKSMHTISSGLTILVGCNGSGKSTFIAQIKQQLKKNNEPVFTFNNVDDGGRSLYGGLIDGHHPGGTEALSSLICSSEGEKIYQNILIKAKKGLGRAVEKAKNSESKELFLLWDAVDSGSSIDSIIDIKNFFKLIIEDQKIANNVDVFAIVSANSYEMANGENCYDVKHNKYVTFKDYEDYKKFILKSRKAKESRLDTYYRKLKEKKK